SPARLAASSGFSAQSSPQRSRTSPGPDATSPTEPSRLRRTCGRRTLAARHNQKGRGLPYREGFLIESRPQARSSPLEQDFAGALDPLNLVVRKTTDSRREITAFQCNDLGARFQAKGDRYEGTLMPHHGFSGEDILTLKLPTGYNVGIAVGDVESIEVTTKPPVTRPERHLPPPTQDKPTVAVLGTGGTIASYVDYRTGAAHPATADLGEVVAVMHGETSDSFGVIHRGTKVRKMHSSRRDAFRSLNAKPLGRVNPDGRVELTEPVLPRARGPTKVDDALD